MNEAQGPFSDYLKRLGVPELRAATCPFDPGVAPVVLESHLAQGSHLMLSLKVSMCCWMVADQSATLRKLDGARRAGISSVAGGGPYEIAVAQNQLPAYLELCAGVGFDAIECGDGFTDPGICARDMVARAHAHGLQVEFELGKKHEGSFDVSAVRQLIEQGREWLGAGARRLTVEARESAVGIGVFDCAGQLNAKLADELADKLGLTNLIFEAPDKPSQFALLDHFGPAVQLGNVPLDELLRVEIYRRGLHSDAFAKDKLRPPAPSVEPVGS
jgi:phosphosulfolactate synthase